MFFYRSMHWEQNGIPGSSLNYSAPINVYTKLVFHYFRWFSIIYEKLIGKADQSKQPFLSIVNSQLGYNRVAKECNFPITL